MSLPASKLAPLYEARPGGPDPWIAVGLAAAKIGVNAGSLRRKCAVAWEAAGLARKIGGAGGGGEWFVHVNADAALRGESDLFLRDAQQIAELRKAGVRPKYIERGEARRRIVLDFTPFWLSRRNMDSRRIVALYVGDCVARNVVGPKCAITKLSVTTFYDWKSRYEHPQHGGISALIDQYGDRAKPAAIGPEAWKQFLEFLHQPGDPSMRDCWKLVDALARTKHARQTELGDAWHWPKYTTVRRHYKKTVHPAEAASARIGPHKTEGRFLPKITRCLEDIAAGQIAVYDERTCDFVIRVPGGDGRWRLARPKLTQTMDVRSRFVGGWVMEESANSDTILAAHLMHCEMTETIPDEAIMDNGEDYRSVAGRANRHRKWDEFDSGRVRGAFERLEIQVHFAKVRTPWSKMIESHFNEDKDGFDRHMPTFCGGSPDERPHDLYRRLNANILDVPTLEEARRMYARHIEVRNDRLIGGDGMGNLSPRQALRQFYTTAPRRIPRETLLLMCCRMRGPVKVRRDGVRYDNVFYGKWDEAVFELQGREVWFLADPVDASFITLCDAHGVAICRAFADNNMGQTRQEVRAAENFRKGANRRLKRYAADRDASLMSTPEAIAELRGQAARLAQIPDDQLVAPPQTETLRLAGSAESAGAERLAKAAGAEAIRKLSDMNAGAKAVNQRAAQRPSFRDLPCDDFDDPPALVPVSFRDLENSNESESPDAPF